MLVNLDMGAFFIIKKEFGIFTFSEVAETFIYLKNIGIKYNLKVNKNSFIPLDKNPVYERQHITQSMQIKAPIAVLALFTVFSTFYRFLHFLAV